MGKLVSGLVIIISTSFHIAHAQDLSGKYSNQTENGTTILTLQADGAEKFSGDLTGNGVAFPLQGTMQNGLLSGTIGDELDGILFQAELKSDYLTFTMVETDSYNNPIPSTAQTLIFQRQAEGEDAPSDKADTDKIQIIINNFVLSKEQITEIENRYGVKPRPGKYWYDTKSGLKGLFCL
ncbi:MAG: hypothetical protein V3U73_10730 [bacterium]